jgi:hypothetical protein
VVRRERDAIPRFLDPHGRVWPEQFNQQALVVGVEMLNQHESHACISRHAVKEAFERIQPSGRSPDANDQRGWAPFGRNQAGLIRGWSVALSFLSVQILSHQQPRVRRTDFLLRHYTSRLRGPHKKRSVSGCKLPKAPRFRSDFAYFLPDLDVSWFSPCHASWSNGFWC